jgi:hypothetical protein
VALEQDGHTEAASIEWTQATQACRDASAT